MTDTTTPSLIVRIPTPVWLVGLGIVALTLDWLLGLPVLFQQRAVGAVLIAIGIASSVWTVRTFRAHKAEIIPASETHSSLVAAGPYRFTRNPMYLNIIVIAVGGALFVGTLLMWLVPVIVFALDNFVIIPFEERSMARTFGDAFRTYQARVRRWL